jgi:hypothetical protein
MTTIRLGASPRSFDCKSNYQWYEDFACCRLILTSDSSRLMGPSAQSHTSHYSSLNSVGAEVSVHNGNNPPLIVGRQRPLFGAFVVRRQRTLFAPFLLVFAETPAG